MELGTENRNKVIIAGVLIVVAVIALGRWLFTGSAPAAAPAASIGVGRKLALAAGLAACEFHGRESAACVMCRDSAARPRLPHRTIARNARN